MIHGQTEVREAYRDDGVAREYVDRRFRSPIGALLHAAIDRLQAGCPGYAARARALTEEEFGLGRLLSQYERLYADILEESRETAASVLPGRRGGRPVGYAASLEESGKRKG